MRARPLPLLVALLAAGCGGGGVPETKGRIAVRVAWPASAARVIPTIAQSIRIQIVQSGTVINESVVTQSVAQATFSDVPATSVTVKAIAYSTVGGTGTPVASGQVVQTVASNVVTPVSITMASTIDHLTVTPNPVNFLIATLIPSVITVTAYDLSGNAVPTAATDISFSSSNVSIAKVSTTGTVTGVALGTCTITATDAISGKSGTTLAKIL